MILIAQNFFIIRDNFSILFLLLLTFSLHVNCNFAMYTNTHRNIIIEYMMLLNNSWDNILYFFLFLFSSLRNCADWEACNWWLIASYTWSMGNWSKLIKICKETWIWSIRWCMGRFMEQYYASCYQNIEAK